MKKPPAEIEIPQKEFQRRARKERRGPQSSRAATKGHLAKTKAGLKLGKTITGKTIKDSI